MPFEFDISRDESTQPMFTLRPNGSNDGQSHLYLPVLLCVDGPQRGERFVLTKESSILGRSATADILLKDDMASRRHARIVYSNWERHSEAPECTVEDLGSRNGTELNGELLNGAVRLRERDRIKIGMNLFGFFLRDEGEVKHEQLLFHMATRDALTGLDNRHQFRMHLAHHVDRSRRSNRPVSLLIVDADRFKSINDTYGHDVGDRALIHLGRMIQSCCRSTEIIARWGGEEFVVLLPETSKDGAARVAERIRVAIEATPLRLASGTLPVTVTIGGAELGASEDPTTFFNRADQQLLRAKENGKNQVSMDPFS